MDDAADPALLSWTPLEEECLLSLVSARVHPWVKWDLVAAIFHQEFGPLRLYTADIVRRKFYSLRGRWRDRDGVPTMLTDNDAMLMMAPPPPPPPLLPFSHISSFDNTAPRVRILEKISPQMPFKWIAKDELLAEAARTPLNPNPSIGFVSGAMPFGAPLPPAPITHFQPDANQWGDDELAYLQQLAANYDQKWDVQARLMRQRFPGRRPYSAAMVRSVLHEMMMLSHQGPAPTMSVDMYYQYNQQARIPHHVVPDHDLVPPVPISSKSSSESDDIDLYAADGRAVMPESVPFASPIPFAAPSCVPVVDDGVPVPVSEVVACSDEDVVCSGGESIPTSQRDHALVPDHEHQDFDFVNLVKESFDDGAEYEEMPVELVDKVDHDDPIHKAVDQILQNVGGDIIQDAADEIIPDDAVEIAHDEIVHDVDDEIVYEAGSSLDIAIATDDVGHDDELADIRHGIHPEEAHLAHDHAQEMSVAVENLVLEDSTPAAADSVVGIAAVHESVIQQDSTPTAVDSTIDIADNEATFVQEYTPADAHLPNDVVVDDEDVVFKDSTPAEVDSACGLAEDEYVILKDPMSSTEPETVVDIVFDDVVVPKDVLPSTEPESVIDITFDEDVLVDDDRSPDDPSQSVGDAPIDEEVSLDDLKPAAAVPTHAAIANQAIPDDVLSSSELDPVIDVAVDDDVSLNDFKPAAADSSNHAAIDGDKIPKDFLSSTVPEPVNGTAIVDDVSLNVLSRAAADSMNHVAIDGDRIPKGVLSSADPEPINDIAFEDVIIMKDALSPTEADTLNDIGIDGQPSQDQKFIEQEQRSHIVIEDVTATDEMATESQGTVEPEVYESTIMDDVVVSKPEIVSEQGSSDQIVISETMTVLEKGPSDDSLLQETDAMLEEEPSDHIIVPDDAQFHTEDVVHSAVVNLPEAVSTHESDSDHPITDIEELLSDSQQHSSAAPIESDDCASVEDLTTPLSECTLETVAREPEGHSALLGLKASEAVQDRQLELSSPSIESSLPADGDSTDALEDCQSHPEHDDGALTAKAPKPAAECAHMDTVQESETIVVSIQSEVEHEQASLQETRAVSKLQLPIDVHRREDDDKPEPDAMDLDDSVEVAHTEAIVAQPSEESHLSQCKPECITQTVIHDRVDAKPMQLEIVREVIAETVECKSEVLRDEETQNDDLQGTDRDLETVSQPVASLRSVTFESKVDVLSKIAVKSVPVEARSDFREESEPLPAIVLARTDFVPDNVGMKLPSPARRSLSYQSCRPEPIIIPGDLCAPDLQSPLSARQIQKQPISITRPIPGAVVITKFSEETDTDEEISIPKLTNSHICHYNAFDDIDTLHGPGYESPPDLLTNLHYQLLAPDPSPVESPSVPVPPPPPPPPRPSNPALELLNHDLVGRAIRKLVEGRVNEPEIRIDSSPLKAEVVVDVAVPVTHDPESMPIPPAEAMVVSAAALDFDLDEHDFDMDDVVLPAEPVPLPESTPPPSKRRGRPPKPADSAKSNRRSRSSAPAVDATTPKKKRGRPRKKKSTPKAVDAIPICHTAEDTAETVPFEADVPEKVVCEPAAEDLPVPPQTVEEEAAVSPAPAPAEQNADEAEATPPITSPPRLKEDESDIVAEIERLTLLAARAIVEQRRAQLQAAEVELQGEASNETKSPGVVHAEADFKDVILSAAPSKAVAPSEAASQVVSPEEGKSQCVPPSKARSLGIAPSKAQAQDVVPPEAESLNFLPSEAESLRVVSADADSQGELPLVLKAAKSSTSLPSQFVDPFEDIEDHSPSPLLNDKASDDRRSIEICCDVPTPSEDAPMDAVEAAVALQSKPIVAGFNAAPTSSASDIERATIQSEPPSEALIPSSEPNTLPSEALSQKEILCDDVTNNVKSSSVVHKPKQNKKKAEEQPVARRTRASCTAAELQKPTPKPRKRARRSSPVRRSRRLSVPVTESVLCKASRRTRPTFEKAVKRDSEVAKFIRTDSAVSFTTMSSEASALPGPIFEGESPNEIEISTQCLPETNPSLSNWHVDNVRRSDEPEANVLEESKSSWRKRPCLVQ